MEKIYKVNGVVDKDYKLTFRYKTDIYLKKVEMP